MKRNNGVNGLRALGLGLALAVAAAGAAQAQVVILVFDGAKIGKDSLAAKDLSNKLTTIGNQLRTELETKAKAIEAEDKALSQILAPLNDQARAQRVNGDLKTRYEAFQRDGQGLQRLQERRRAELDLTSRCAEGEFAKQLRPIIDEVSKARNATIMIDRANVTWASPTTDVTAEILQKLDAKVKAINVIKVNIPDPVPDGFKPACG